MYSSHATYSCASSQTSAFCLLASLILVLQLLYVFSPKLILIKAYFLHNVFTVPSAVLFPSQQAPMKHVTSQLHSFPGKFFWWNLIKCLGDDISINLDLHSYFKVITLLP